MSKKKFEKDKKLDYISVLLCLAPFITGLFSIWSLALFSILCLGGIIYKVIKNKKIIMPYGRNLVFILVYLLSFFVVQFYAVDKGMNLLACFKNLAIILFVFLYVQHDDTSDNNKSYYDRFSIIPYSAALSVIISLIMAAFPNSETFYNNRLHGLFFYANSYGLFLLISGFIHLNKKEFNWKDYLVFLILFVGIVLTNSRAIIILTLLTMVAVCIINRDELKNKIILVCGFVAVFACFYAFSNLDKRIDTEMLSSSEFVSRLLYYSYAVKMVADNPFGYGYEGWYYKQGETQTGVYDTKFVHNSLLQFALDVGIIPTAFLVALVISVFFDKSQNSFSRIIMILILGHSIIDIDLEYIYFIVLLIPFIPFNRKEIDIDKKVPIVVATCSVAVIWYFMIFLSDAFYTAKDYKNAIRIIPFHTDALQELLYSVTDNEEQLEYANTILKFNENVSGAYEANINELIQKKEYMEAIKLEEKRLALNKYSMINYISYAQLLSDGLSYYGKKNESKYQEEIIEKICGIEDRINKVLEETNPLCYKTIHTPQLDMPEELSEFIEKAKRTKS
jgi:hypothetical protein